MGNWRIVQYVRLSPSLLLEFFNVDLAYQCFGVAEAEAFPDDLLAPHGGSQYKVAAGYVIADVGSEKGDCKLADGACP